ncbi:hypothetical protein [Niabella ginsengisoli]|uniref:Uncharacterized protein n=1 Tax=Niabella ginsengisoli TaxID=522298 RepID=A0ABS9SH96_9BACT|nr:hypothetical protein [Niabella ginsengisoli]MCH5597710.1 hypothetical protein [Niabella ginsengisoli]
MIQLDDGYYTITYNDRPFKPKHNTINDKSQTGEKINHPYILYLAWQKGNNQ